MESELIRISKDFASKEGLPEFTDDARINKFLNEDPNAFILGCVMDKQIPAERAWAIPYKIYKELGNFEIDFLAEVPLDEYKKMFKENKYHRFNDKCAVDFYEAVQKIKKDYGGDVSKIWADNPTSKEVIKEIRDFKGVGPNISNMAANILAREYKVKMQDYSSLDVSTDIHITRVMTRLYFEGDVTKKQIVQKAREISPEYPALIDLACRVIGKDYCRPTEPECYHCPLNKECNYNK